MRFFQGRSYRNLLCLTIFLTQTFGTGCAALIRAQADRDDQSGRRDHGGIYMGMKERQVLRNWGEPRVVENAGHPEDGNARWVYFSGLSSRWSLSPMRIVYFENGVVVGWETQ